MQTDSYILPECIVRPGSFGGLMVLYEANFIKLNQLVYSLGYCAGSAVSRSPTDCDLYLNVEDRTAYTCQLRLTYLFAEESHAAYNSVAEPDLLAKVYLDARIVEVRSWVSSHRHEILSDLDTRFRRPLDLCWARNIMLSKWLDYVLDQGHSFSARSFISA